MLRLAEGAKDRQALGDGVYKQYGVGRDGFDIVSCQFAIHYFFKDKLTIHNFYKSYIRFFNTNLTLPN